jgi:predicted PhzF superfamily epimerase YddE/YHI9
MQRGAATPAGQRAGHAEKTMRLPIYQVDAFADRVFGGNPAAVCPLDAWLPDATMQAIAAENNLAETAFFVPEGSDYALRWFTPTVEVDLCGHATLASAHVVLSLLQPERDRVDFHTVKAGTLTVAKRGDLLVMDFPAWPAAPAEPPPGLIAALGERRATFCAPATISWSTTPPPVSPRSSQTSPRSPNSIAGPPSRPHLAGTASISSPASSRPSKACLKTQ